MMNDHPLAMTVDVEKPYSKVEAGTNRILALLDGLSVKATFFVVGDIAERYPGLIKTISKLGHELGFHAAEHIPLAHTNRERFLDDLTEWKCRLEDLSGQCVQGFRAPYFSLQKSTRWAFDCLVDAGYRYDSSIYPGLNVKHGWFGAPMRPVKIANTDLISFPVPMMGRFLPIAFSGGGFLGLLPKWLIRQAMFLQYASGLPGMIYVHPWQMMIETRTQNKIINQESGSFRDRLLNAMGRDRVDQRLCYALKVWRGPISTMAHAIDQLHHLPIWDPRGAT